MKKDRIIAEYTRLCRKYTSFSRADPVDELELLLTIKRIHHLRHKLGMEPITLGGINGKDLKWD